MSVPPPRAPAERLIPIIDLLCRALGGRVTRPGRPGLPSALLVLIWNRLRRLAGRITRLAAKIEAGIPPSAPRPRAPRPQRTTPPPGAPPMRLPRGRAWLIRLVPYDAAGGASQLQHLLAQPEMAPLLADPRMGRLLRPLCHMLGLAPPPEIAKPRPAAPAAAPPSPDSVPAPAASEPRAAPPKQRRTPPRHAAPKPRPVPAACGPPALPA